VRHAQTSRVTRRIGLCLSEIIVPHGIIYRNGGSNFGGVPELEADTVTAEGAVPTARDGQLPPANGT
jgi:hypothetical protein